MKILRIRVLFAFFSLVFAGLLSGCTPDTGISAVSGAPQTQLDTTEDTHTDLPTANGDTPSETDEKVPPKKDDAPIPPAVVDSLVTKYGCSDSTDEGKDSNEKKILICHVPMGN